MKVIDLLNKIANGEEVPKKIKTEEDIFEYMPIACDYKVTETTINYWLFKDYVFGGNGNSLNDEVEIIEEDNKIEKIIINSCGNIEKKLIDGSTIVLPTNKDEILHIAYKLNELMDAVNELKKGD